MIMIWFPPSPAVYAGQVLHPKKTGPETYDISRAEAVVFATHLKANTQDARLEPAREGERVVGYRFTQMEPTSVYAEVGLKLNDVILSINGHSVAEKMDPTTLITLLTLEDHYTVKYRRAGASRVLHLNLVQ